MPGILSHVSPFQTFPLTSKRRGNRVTFPTQIQTVFSECLFSTLGLLSSQPDSKMRWKPVASNRSPLLIKPSDTP